MAIQGRKSTKPVRESYVPLLEGCRDSALDHLSTRLAIWFTELDTALMDAADGASDNRSQLRFMEAIKVIGGKKQAILDSFRQEIRNGFKAFLAGDAIHYPFEAKRGEQTLSLMDTRQEEDYLAVRKIADRYQSRWPEVMYGLEQRLSMTRGGRRVDPQDIPAGPLHTTFAFQTAIRKLGLEEPIYEVLYRLFARQVLHNIVVLYQDFNSRMIKAGIFPNLRYLAEKQPERTLIKAVQPAAPAKEAAQAAAAAPTQPSPPPPPPRSGDPEEAAVFDTISDILSKRRRQDPRFRSHPELNPFAPARQMTDDQTLVDTLQQLQPERVSASYLPSPDDQGIGRVATAEVHQQQLSERRSGLDGEQQAFFARLDHNSIRAKDLDVIEMVGMLFEQILDEDDLPNLVKALLSYLHTPYLKAGIMDPDFLTDPQHSARKLLNLMVHAGRYWVDDTDLRRGIYYPLKRAVDRILGEFRNDLSLFDEVMKELWDQVEQLEKKADSMEQRSRDAAAGHQRLTSAREKASAIIDEYVSDRALHPDLRTFLYEVWLERLSFMLLRNPEAEQSREWADTVMVVQTLIMAFDGRVHPDMPERMRAIFPNLRDYIEKSLFSLGDFHQPKAQRLFQRYEAFFDGDLSALASNQPPPSKPAEADQQPTDSSTKPHLSEAEEQMVQRLEQLPFGTWFELNDGKTRQRRLKLSWHNPNSRRFMFVDQSGVQALMITSEELAQRLCAGEGKILDPSSSDTPFVGRALRRIREALSGLSSQPPQVCAHRT